MYTFIRSLTCRKMMVNRQTSCAIQYGKSNSPMVELVQKCPSMRKGNLRLTLLARGGFGYGTEMWYHPSLHKNSKSGVVELFEMTLKLYSYCTTNKMHLFLKLFILVKCSTCFGRSVGPSSGAQNCRYACCRMCSFELLMMDGKTVRNM
jgi:hypothetical protein